MTTNPYGMTRFTDKVALSEEDVAQIVRDGGAASCEMNPGGPAAQQQGERHECSKVKLLHSTIIS